MSGLSGAVTDRCPRPTGSYRPSMARRWRRAWSARRGSAGSPTAGSPAPGGWLPRRYSGRSAGGRAGGACSCRTFARPACDARPAASRALPGRPRPATAGGRTGPGQRTRPGRRARTGPAGGPAQHRVLMPEHQQFSVLRLIPAAYRHDQLEYPAHQQVRELQSHPASQPSPHQACSRYGRSTIESAQEHPGRGGRQVPARPGEHRPHRGARICPGLQRVEATLAVELTGQLGQRHRRARCGQLGGHRQRQQAAAQTRAGSSSKLTQYVGAFRVSGGGA
jgi:hypothetical protein